MENNVKTLNDQLKELPDEFKLAMEEYREIHFLDVLKLINLAIGKENDFDLLSEEEKSKLIAIFSILHNYGFYAGVSFTLDPDQKYIPKYYKENGQ